MFVETLTQGLSILDWQAPASTANGTVNGAAVDMSYVDRLIYDVQIGAVGAAGTITCQIQGSANGTSGWTNITALVSTAVSTANQIVTVEAKAEDLGGSGTPYYRYARLQVVVGVNAVVFGYIAKGGVPRHHPANKYNQIAAVNQQVVQTP